MFQQIALDGIILSDIITYDSQQRYNVDGTTGGTIEHFNSVLKHIILRNMCLHPDLPPPPPQPDGPPGRAV